MTLTELLSSFCLCPCIWTGTHNPMQFSLTKLSQYNIQTSTSTRDAKTREKHINVNSASLKINTTFHKAVHLELHVTEAKKS